MLAVRYLDTKTRQLKNTMLAIREWILHLIISIKANQKYFEEDRFVVWIDPFEI